MRNLTVLSFLLLVTASGWAEDNKPVFVYAAPKAEGPINLDGALDEPAWQNAPLASGFTFFGQDQRAEVQTSFRLLYDDQALYLSVIGDEPLMGKVAPAALPRDEHGVFSQECIEFFIDPQHSHSQYYQIAANLAGSIYDSEYTDTTWQGTTSVQGRLGEKAWTMEWRLPWADYGLKPEPNLLLGFNVCRDRYTGPVREWTNWSQVIGGFHDPARFAHLVLSPTAEQLGARRDDYRKGGRTGPLRFFVPDELSDQIYRPLIAQALKQVRDLLAEIEAVHGKMPAGGAKTELGNRIGAIQAELNTIQGYLDSEASRPSEDWIKADLRLTELAGGMDTLVWEARLKALLAEI